ncbi:MAG: HEAT repeat domain-containing protein [Planctomycetota bacterium]
MQARLFSAWPSWLLASAFGFLVAAVLPLAAEEAGKKEEEAKLLALLQSNAEPAQKDQACRRLAVVGSKAAIPVLSAMLADEKLCDVARFGLQAIPDPAVDEALRGELGKLKGKQLMGVIFSLGNRRDQEAADALAKLLSDPDLEVAAISARALGKIGGPVAAKALDRALGTAPEALRPVLGEASVTLADALLVQEKREEALAVFDRIRASGLLPKRIVAAGFRGSVLARQAAGIPLLLEQLKSDDKDMRRMAFRLAREMPGTEATRALAAELSKLPQEGQIQLLEALGNRRDVAALPAIVESGKSGETAVRIAALRVMGEVADSSVVPVLFDAAIGPQAEVAKAAQATLAGLPDSKELNDAIVSVADKGEPKVRRVALEAIAERRIVAATPVLFKAAGDADAQIRAAALRALGETGSLADLEALAGKLVKPQSPQEIAMAETTLEAIFRRTEKKDACAEKLLACLPQAEGASKCAVLRLLHITGGAAALQAVRAACKDASAEVQDAAMRALLAWPTAEPAADVLEIARTSANETYKVLALRGYVAMIALKELPLERKLAMCKEAMGLAKSPEQKKLVLSGLGETPHPEALKMIEECLNDEAVRAEAERALLKNAQGMAGSSPNEAKAALNRLIASTINVTVKKQAQALVQQIGKAK